ncbi:DUF5392 family protein [Bacillus sp. V5-8f]|uniref:DUF5392 family protein n=1 Tax=Bacillus sp. V5-8f TaxID=2053044 RepID=UPI0015E0F223
MKQSAIASESLKNEYIALVKEQPSAAKINHFINFLNEEEKQKNMIMNKFGNQSQFLFRG